MQRPRPHRDDKVISAWNGLAIAALAEAAAVLREPRYLKVAEEAAAFLQEELFDEQKQRLVRGVELERILILVTVPSPSVAALLAERGGVSSAGLRR